MKITKYAITMSITAALAMQSGFGYGLSNEHKSQPGANGLAGRRRQTQ